MKWLDGIRHDVRFALRRLRRDRGYAFVAIATLALGLGATASVFSAINAILLAPLPFEEADRLVRLRDVYRRAGGETRAVNAATPNYLAWKEQARSFASMGAAEYQTFTWTGTDEPRRIGGVRATADFLPTLGVDPVIGRGILPDEDRADGPADVALISHGLWTRSFGGERDAIGSTITLNGRPVTIVGVLPPGFRYPYSAEIWTPIGLDSSGDDDHALNVAARLAPGATIESARAEMDAIAARLARARPETNRGFGVGIVSIREEVLEGVDAKLLALLAAAVFVLLIAAANVASLTLARSRERGRQVAVRAALGAGRGRLVRQLLVESVVVAVLGGGLGLLLATWGAGALAALSPASDMGTYFRDVGLDLRVVGFGLLAAALVGIGFGLLPALRASRIDLSRILRSGDRRSTGRGQRTFDVLVALEVAVAVILLTGAGLMLRSVHQMRSADPGIDLERTLALGISPSEGGRRDPAETVAHVDRILERVEAVPGVERAAASTLNPLRDAGWGAAVWPEDRPRVDEQERLTVNHRAVTPGWFEATGTAVLRGRGFRESDRPGSEDVVVVSESAASTLWPNDDPLGKRVRQIVPDGDAPWLTVVGVVEDVADHGDLEETWYRPYAQDPREFPTRTIDLVVRADGDPTRLVTAVREAIQRVDPDLPVFDVSTMGALLGESRRFETITTLLLTIFAGLGVTLAAIGLYGVLSYGVARRTREIGIRMALGAGPAEVLRPVLASGIGATVAGLVAGILGALVLSRYLESFLVGVPPRDPITFAAVAAGALGVAALASWLPARRALRLDPMRVLRDE